MIIQAHIKKLENHQLEMNHMPTASMGNKLNQFDVTFSGNQIILL